MDQTHQKMIYSIAGFLIGIPIGYVAAHLYKKNSDCNPNNLAEDSIAACIFLIFPIIGFMFGFGIGFDKIITNTHPVVNYFKQLLY